MSTSVSSAAPSPQAVAATDSIGGPNPIVGFRRKDLLDSVRSVVGEAARNPRRSVASLAHLANAAVRGPAPACLGSPQHAPLDPAPGRYLRG